MAERSNTGEETIRREIGLSEKDIKLLYSLTPDNFTEFRNTFNAKLMDEQRVIIFCAA
ncbi:MAG: hypothetical protein HXS44_06190 [Theionarchaea archaeon]|nr:hypothetical protein [Theionarchaea archaeon]